MIVSTCVVAPLSSRRDPASANCSAVQVWCGETGFKGEGPWLTHMEQRERLLYHQIHPVKLATDVTTAAVGVALLWQHRLGLALLVGFVPSIVVSIFLVTWGNLEQYRSSAFGRYVGRFMTRRVELARFAGLLPFWGGAWLHQPVLIVFGALWIVGCWLRGLRTST